MNRTSTYIREIAGGEEPDIIRLVNLIVLDGVSAGASDIHIEAWDESVAVRVRIDGVLTELVHLPLDWMERIQQRFKVMASLVSYQSDIPQEGQVPADPDIGGVELRVSYFPTVRGGKTVIRIFDPRSRKFDLDTLGLDPDVLEDFKLLLTQPNGLMLLTGPTGSGKTTLIYSALTSIVHREGPSVSISTVEDPVEARLSMVSQAQINPAKDFTYPLALRSLLRQDPQVIMIGEIRDPETAMIALRASLTGHLVISTIHSGSCAGVFARLINMQIEPFLLASSIIGIIGLRLMRQNCEYCARPYEPEPALVALLQPGQREHAYFRKADGCDECHRTGYGGRIAVAELLRSSERLKEAVIRHMTTSTLEHIAVEDGFVTLWRRGLRRALDGQTPLEEVLRVIPMDSGVKVAE